MRSAGAFIAGTRGTLVDLQLAARTWQIRPPRRDIPAFIWHGGRDADSPVAIGRYLAAALPRSTLEVFPGDAHVSAFIRHAENIIVTLRGTAEDAPAQAFR